jgi:hypothetical protein
LQFNEVLAESPRRGSAFATTPAELSAEVAKPLVKKSKDQFVAKLTPEATRPSPPSDCDWTEVDDFDTFSFVQKGRFSLGTVLNVLSLATFLNGILGLFVGVLLGVGPGRDLKPQSVPWWFLFCFLIPFEIFGVLIWVGLLGAIAAPVHRIRWTFARNRISYRNSWFGIGWQRTWPVEKLDRIELRTGKGRTPWKLHAPSESEITPYYLSFVEGENREVCSIRDLTEGEARWIGQTMLRKRAAWFR